MENLVECRGARMKGFYSVRLLIYAGSFVWW